MLHTSVVSFYDNFGLIFNNLEDRATKGIANWPLSTTPLLTDASVQSEFSPKLLEIDPRRPAFEIKLMLSLVS